MEARCVRIFPPPLHIVAPGEKSKRSGIYIYILENLVSLFVEEATEVAEEEPGETPELVAQTPKAKETP